MTKLKTYLEAMREVEGRATKGPWELREGFDRFSASPGCYGLYLELGDNGNVLMSGFPGEAKFIATSRNEWNRLLEIIETLMGACEDWQEEIMARDLNGKNYHPMKNALAKCEELLDAK